MKSARTAKSPSDVALPKLSQWVSQRILQRALASLPFPEFSNTSPWTSKPRAEREKED